MSSPSYKPETDRGGTGLDTGPGQETQSYKLKPKSKLITKFFNEPVDALDLRLANAEENLSVLPVDPFKDIKHTDDNSRRPTTNVSPPAHYHTNSTLLQSSRQDNESSRPTVLEYGHEEQQTGAHNHEEDSEDESFIQRVTIRAGNNLYRHHHSPPIPHPPHHSHHSEPGGSGWRISPIPWRMMIPEENTYPEPGPSSAEDYHYHDREQRDQYHRPVEHSIKRSHEEVSIQGYPHLKRLKSSPVASDIDDIDRRISMAESCEGTDNPLLDHNIQGPPPRPPRLPMSLVNREVKQEEGEVPDTWWRNFPPESQLYPAPSSEYIQRYQELVAQNIKREFRAPNQNPAESTHPVDSRHPNLEPYLNSRLQASRNTAANMSASYLSSLHHANQPHPHQNFVTKPQRKNSVIVRNNASASATSITTGSEIRSDLGDFPQSKQLSPTLSRGNQGTCRSSPLQMSSPNKVGHSLQQDWLKQLQNLRSGFEKNMQQLKQNPSHHFPPHPLHHHQHHPHFPPSTQSSLEYDNIPPLTRSLQTKSVHSRNLETSAAYFSEGHISTSLSRIKREQVISSSTSSPPDRDDELSGASPPSPESSTSPISPPNYPPESPTLTSSSSISGPGPGKGKRGRPRKHAPKLPLPPLYVFIRNMLHNPGYNPSVIAWVDDEAGCFKVTNTMEFARTWGQMKSNRSEEMNYEKMSRAMRYHYGCERQGRKGHLAMVKEKRLYYKFGELARNWRRSECVEPASMGCATHKLCRNHMCLWSKE